MIAPRARVAVLGAALSLTVAGSIAAATRSVPVVATVNASSPERSQSRDDETDGVEGEAVTSTPETTQPVASPTSVAKTGAAAPTATTTPSANPATGTVLEPAEQGVYVLDVTTGELRKADARGPFDVVGQTLYVAHGTTVHAMPISGGPATPVITVPGATRLEWIEMSPLGSLLTQWSVPDPVYQNSWSRYVALVAPDGHVIMNQLLGNHLEWSPDGSYFVIFDYRGISAIKADGSAKWGPIATPEQSPHDVEFTPDGKHVLASFSQETYAIDLSSKEWSQLAARSTVSVMADGKFATSPVPPDGWDGRTPIGTILTDLAGNASKLTASGSEPTISASGAHVIYIDEPLRRIGSRGSFTYRVATRGGKVLYTISKPGWELGRDEMRSGGPGGDGWLEGPQWSADGRYVAVGVYNPYPN